MDTVIRPTFGRPVSDGRRTAQPDTFCTVSPLRVYGTTVGHFVAPIRAETGDEGPTLQLVGGEGAESVAVFLNEAEADAEATAFAILRALEIVKEAMVGSRTGGPQRLALAPHMRRGRAGHLDVRSESSPIPSRA